MKVNDGRWKSGGNGRPNACAEPGVVMGVRVVGQKDADGICVTDRRARRNGNSRASNVVAYVAQNCQPQQQLQQFVIGRPLQTNKRRTACAWLFSAKSRRSSSSFDTFRRDIARHLICFSDAMTRSPRPLVSNFDAIARHLVVILFACVTITGCNYTPAGNTTRLSTRHLIGAC